MDMKKIEIDTFITENSDWQVKDDQLIAKFELADFSEVQAKIKEIMKIADEQNHHPTVTFSYKTIEIKTVTHDAGNTLTDRDFELAKAVSSVVAE